MGDGVAAARRVALIAAVAAVVAAAAAGCGGQSDRGQVTAVARAYDHAFVARDGHRLCALMTPSLRRTLTSGTGVSGPGACAKLLTFTDGSLHAASEVHPVLSSVRVTGSRATATFRTTAGVGRLPLAREGGKWQVSGTVHYVSRVWLKADYRVRRSGGSGASAIADILAARARVIVGTPVQARAIGADEISLAVAEPVRPADLALVTHPEAGGLAFYDWKADALTPDGQPVSEGLRRRNASALLISQGSGTKPPGTGGGSMSRRDAARLADRQRASGWAVVRAWAPIGGAGEDAPQFYVLRDRPGLSRADVTAAYAATDPLGNPDIALSFTPRGMRRFQRLTAELAQRGAAVSGPDLSLNQHIAAVLDGQLLSVLYVDFRAHPNGISAVNGAQITGGFTPTTAQQLAREIAAPPLPASLERIDSATVTRRGG